MRDRFCWDCGHTQDKHTYVGGCSFGGDGGCDCARYEDGEFYGLQLKRDTYTLSDRRRLRPRRRVATKPPPPAEPRREQPPEELKMAKLDAHLAEYVALREEINRRLDAQRQAFNYTVAVLGAFVAGAGLIAGKDGVDPAAIRLVPHMLLLLPLIIGPLAFIFFDDELILYRNIFHICLHLREKVAEEFAQPGVKMSGADKPFLVEAEGLGRLDRLSQNFHTYLSFSRWLLFIAPVVLPLLVYRMTEPHIRNNPVQIDKFKVHVQPISEILFGLDLVIAVFLGLAITCALREQRSWKSKLGTEASKAAYAARRALK